MLTKHFIEKSFTILALLTLCTSVMAQRTGFSGKVIDSQQQAIPGAFVFQSDSARNVLVNPPVQSGSDGSFALTEISPKTRFLKITHVGFESIWLEVDPTKPGQRLRIILPELTQALQEVAVTGKTETAALRETGLKTNVINTREAYIQPATLADLINRSPGVRLRQAGGLGSTPEISLNGFQGRSIRYFRDGVPIDYLRDGYNIASVPVDQLERIEIYKGVLPVSLGGDALGGAVNVVSRRLTEPQLNVSYEIASFNTHRVSLSGFYSPQSGKWFAGADAFYNHSDNDYKAKVKVTDPITKNQVEERVRLFHNGFTSGYAEVYGGLRNLTPNDELKISLAAFSLERQQQHPALMTDPYGAVLSKQKSIVPSVQYRKSWKEDRISLSHFMVLNTLTINRVDTLRGQYDWYGNFTPVSWRVGETRQTALSDVRFHNFISRTHLKVQLNPVHLWEINYVYSHSKREGEDPYGVRFDGTDTDVLSVPAIYGKHIITTGLESNFGVVTNNVMVKYFRFRSKGVEAWAAREIKLDEQVSQESGYWGVADAVKYAINEHSFVRISAELSRRLPEQDELFGDAIWVVPNFNIQPEKSLNINLGYRIQKPQKFTLEANGFFRRTTDLILLVPTQAPYAQYQNMEKVRGFGAELDGAVQVFRNWQLNANLTWLDMRLFGFELAQDKWRNGARLRNTPYFFANATITRHFRDLFKKNDALSVHLHYNLIREFYLETIPKSSEPDSFLGLFGSARISSDLIIPTQHLLNAGATYKLSGNRASVGLEVKNLLNSDLYDYFRVQRAGRSFHLKITWSIRK